MHILSLLFRRSRTGLALLIWLLVSHSQAQAEPVRLLALGDSLTAGYGLAHEQGFVMQLQAEIDREKLDARLIDAGVSGDTSADALARLDWALGDDPAEAPQGAIVELGGNDGLRGLPPAQMERNIAAILDRLQARGLPVLLSGMVAPPNMGAAYAAEFHGVFERLFRRPGLIVDPFFLQDVALHDDLVQGDHIHPNERGVRVIVARLMPAVRLLIARARNQPSKP